MNAKTENVSVEELTYILNDIIESSKCKSEKGVLINPEDLKKGEFTLECGKHKILFQLTLDSWKNNLQYTLLSNTGTTYSWEYYFKPTIEYKVVCTNAQNLYKLKHCWKEQLQWVIGALLRAKEIEEDADVGERLLLDNQFQGINGKFSKIKKVNVHGIEVSLNMEIEEIPGGCILSIKDNIDSLGLDIHKRYLVGCTVESSICRSLLGDKGPEGFLLWEKREWKDGNRFSAMKDVVKDREEAIDYNIKHYVELYNVLVEKLGSTTPYEEMEEKVLKFEKDGENRALIPEITYGKTKLKDGGFMVYGVSVPHINFWDITAYAHETFLHLWVVREGKITGQFSMQTACRNIVRKEENYFDNFHIEG